MCICAAEFIQTQIKLHKIQNFFICLNENREKYSKIQHIIDC